MSLESDRSFATYEEALAHVTGPRLPADTSLFWEQGILDVLFEYPIQSAAARFSIHPGWRHLAASVSTVLRYVARLEAGRATVGLVELPPTHAFAHIRLTDNVIQFTTRRYKDNPLVVQGPGAGPEVTAAGVFADLLRVAAALGARV